MDEDEVDKELDIDWVVSLCNIFGKFYSDNDIENSMNELYVMILKEGKWGDQINRLQNSVSISTEDNLKTNVERVILQQDKMIPTRNMWEVLGKSQFKRVWNIALRLYLLAVQSVNIE